MRALDRHAIEMSVRVLDGPPARFLVSTRVALNGDDGADPRPVLFALEKAGVVVRSQPDSDVGRRFPEEARKIHYQEVPPRAIRGQASHEEAKALSDEGIDFASLPPFLSGETH